MMHRLFAAVLLLLSGAASSGFLYYEQPDPTPYLAGIGTLPACDFVIDSVADWSEINNAAYRVFCVAPGDYRSIDRIVLRTDGTAEAKRWIRYYDPTGTVGDNVHPYHMTTAQRAQINRVIFDSANHWIVDRLYIDSTNVDAAILFVLSDNNVLNRLYLYDVYQGIVIANGSEYNVVQYTVVQKMTHGSDGVAFQLHGRNYDGLHPVLPPKFNRIVSNECIDVNDCGHLSGNDPKWTYYTGEEDYEGTVFYNNDFYLTSASYTNCDGGYTPTGDCACKENAFDIKSGTENPANPVIVAHNRMWGWKPLATLDTTCTGPSGPASTTVDFVNHFLVKNIRVEGNIFDSGGMALGEDHINATFTSNLLGPLVVATTTAAAYSPYGLLVAGTVFTDVTISGNVFSEINDQASHLPAWFQSGSLTSATVTFSDNVFINSNAVATTSGTFAGTVSGNKYYNTVKPSWDTNPAVNVATVTGSGWDNQFCTTRKRITAPETWCLDNALYLTGDPIPITSPSQFNPAD